MPTPEKLYLAFGEKKTMKQWLADSRCAVGTPRTIYWRMRHGASFEEALSIVGWNAKRYIAFGEEKSLPEWGRDSRCRIKYGTLYFRVEVEGASLEEALTRPLHLGLTRNRTVTAFGETKSISEWIDDPRCTVTRTGLVLRLKRGINPEQAICGTPFDSTLLVAFGESKSVSDWIRDPRCVVSRYGLMYRLQQGETLEEAMTRPGRKEVSERFWDLEGPS